MSVWNEMSMMEGNYQNDNTCFSHFFSKTFGKGTQRRKKESENTILLESWRKFWSLFPSSRLKNYLWPNGSEVAEWCLKLRLGLLCVNIGTVQLQTWNCSVTISTHLFVNYITVLSSPKKSQWNESVQYLLSLHPLMMFMEETHQL